MSLNQESTVEQLIAERPLTVRMMMGYHEGLAAQCESLAAAGNDNELLEKLTTRYKDRVGFSPFDRESVQQKIVTVLKTDE